MIINVRTVLITLRRVSSQRNELGNLFKCHNTYFQHSKRTTLNTNIVLGLGIMPFIPKIAAESGQKIIKVDEIVDVTKNTEEKTHTIDKTGWERLCAMYKFDEFGNASKEITATFQATCVAVIVGLLYGGANSSRLALNDFIERNQASIFENHLDAKRRLRNHVTVHFGKGAFHWASRLSIFTGGFMLLLTSMSVYRGGHTVVDYGISGALVGSILRFRLGPRAMAAGGALGGFLGAFCGLMTKTLLSLTGSSFDEVLSFQYEVEKKRNDLFKAAEAKNTEEKEMSKEVVNLLKECEKNKKEF